MAVLVEVNVSFNLKESHLVSQASAGHVQKQQERDG